MSLLYSNGFDKAKAGFFASLLLGSLPSFLPQLLCGQGTARVPVAQPPPLRFAAPLSYNDDAPAPAILGQALAENESKALTPAHPPNAKPQFNLINSATWTSIGPYPLTNGQTQTRVDPVSGRVTAIAVHPANSNIVYAGAAQGGVYRSLNGGTNWTAIMDMAQSLAIGAITIDPVNPSTVFVGTGEGNLSLDSFFGVGIYRIINADTTPTVQGPFESRSNGGSGHAFVGTSITKIIIDPNNNNNVFVANTLGGGGVSGDGICCGGVSPVSAFVGLYFSANAQAATPTWVRVNPASLPGGGLAGVTDMAIDPTNANTLIIAQEDFSGSTNSGIFRSVNALSGASATYTLTLNYSNSQYNVKFAMNRTGPTLTLLAGTEESSGTLRRSVDGGATWPTVVSAPAGFCGGQCFYDIVLAMPPNDTNIIYMGGAARNGSSHIFMKSTNAGVSFLDLDTGLHADSHAFAFDPSNLLTIYFGNDGGIWKSRDGGTNWFSLNNTNFSATQFQSLALHPRDRNFMIGGTQDNGTEWLRPDGTWIRADFGDGGFSLIDQNATDTTNVTMYHTYFNKSGTLIGFGRVTNTANATDGGWSGLGAGLVADPDDPDGGDAAIANGLGTNDTVLFYAPMALGPGNPNTLYFGTDRLYRSSDKGATMVVVSQAPLSNSVAISAIGISPQNDNVRIVGLRNGKVYATMNGSSNLTDVTGSISARYVARAVIDPNNTNTAYVALAGFGQGAGNHVWKTTNLSGGSWFAAGSGIPDIPVNAFVIDPRNSSHLYAGTDNQVYSSSNGGTNWAVYGSGLPVVSVFDIAIQDSFRVLRIATHGRGIYEILPMLLPDLSVSLSATNPVILHSNLTYTLSITSLNTAAANVTVTDTLPATVTFVSASPGFATNGNTVTWSLGSIPGNATSNLTLVVTANTLGSVTNSATVSTTTLETNLANNSATLATTVYQPVLTAVCTSNKTVECGSAWSFDVPSASTTCATTNITVTVLNTATNGLCPLVITRTWQLSDVCGDSTTCTQIVTAVDTTPPSLTCASNKTVECGSGWSFDPPAASDLCNGTNVVVTILSTTTNGSCPQVLTRTWLATDPCGNTNTCSQTVTVADTTPPSLTCASNKTVECGSAWGFDPPIASDICSGTNVAVIVLTTVTNGSCPLFTTRTWQATDQCGNMNTCTQTVTVVDTTPPSLTCASNKIVGCGTCFSTNGQPNETILKRFSGGTDGQNPQAGLVEGADGTLYGTTVGRTIGPGSKGTVFKVSKDGSGYSVLRNLDGSNDGRAPYAGLLLASDGALYGTASDGGSNFNGTVFKLNLDGSAFTVLRSFPVTNGDGYAPYAGVIEGGDGALYGATYGGGVTGAGTIFTMNKDGSGYAILYSFAGPPTDGDNPTFTLLQGRDGALYGVTGSGGTGGQGTVFKLNKDGSGYMALRNFPGAAGDGRNPSGPLVQGNDGTLYGTTAAGGDNDYGLVFSLSVDGSSYSVLRSFQTTGGDGQSSRGGLVFAKDGGLYGTTDFGSTSPGTIFRLDTTGANYRILYQFGNAPDGANPLARLLQASDGAFYGTTSSGGTGGSGTVFRLGCEWSFDTPLAMDTCCGSNLSLSILSTVSNGACPQTITRTWQATDCCSNSTTCSQTITITGTNPPFLTCSPDKSVECGSGWSFDAPTASDNCCTNVIVLVLATVTNGSCPQIITRTWQAMDCCSNLSTICTQTVTAADTTPPTITCASNKTVNCGSSWNFDPPTASDACSGTNVMISIVGTTTNVCPPTITRTWSAADPCGNISICSQTVAFAGTNAPVVTCSSNKTVECGSAWSFDTPLATDACSGGLVPVQILSTVTNGACPQLITRTWQVPAMPIVIDSFTNGSQFVFANALPSTNSGAYGNDPIGNARVIHCDDAAQQYNVELSVASGQAVLDASLSGTSQAHGEWFIEYGDLGDLRLDLSTTLAIRTLSVALHQDLNLTIIVNTTGGGSSFASTTIPAGSTSFDLPLSSLKGLVNLAEVDRILVKFSATVAGQFEQVTGILAVPEYPCLAGRTISICTQTVAVVDTTPPSLICASNKTMECGPCFTGSNTVSCTDLHNFGSTDFGQLPYGSLLVGNDGMLYGTTDSGGSNQAGTVFKVAADGTGYTVLHHFGSVPGDGLTPYSGVMQASDGKLYGTTLGGGSSYGTIFQLNTDGSGYQVDYSFTGGNDGSYPQAGLAEGNGSFLYGAVGLSIFKINRGGSGFSVIYHLPFVSGRYSSGPLTIGSDGTLYGVAANAFVGSDFGIVFKLNSDGSSFQTIWQPPSASTGTAPSGKLLIGSDGMLYGTTLRDGANGLGSIFKVGTLGTGFSVLKFLTSPEGVSRGGLIEGNGGALYGTAIGAGGGFGVVFKLNKDGSGFTNLHAFAASGGDGQSPRDALTVDNVGTMYGATPSGGAVGYGTLFRILSNGSGYAVLRSFLGDEGDSPHAGLTVGNDGTLYGTTYQGGDSGIGAIFRQNPDGSGYTVLHSFAHQGDGYGPQAAVIIGPGGALYGTTSYGGSNDLGTTFKLNTDGTGYLTLRNFANADGASPELLLAGSDGALYGLASSGGSGGVGTLFKFNPDSSGFAVLHIFTGTAGDGSEPVGALLEASDGALYGVTTAGGTKGSGTIFKLNKNGTGYAVLFTLPSDDPTVVRPGSGLLEARDGALYGTTLGNGVTGFGSVYRLNRDGTGFQVLKRFLSMTDGSGPGSLLDIGDGAFYGTTSGGGPSGLGTAFRLNPDGSGFAVIKGFGQNDGHSPNVSLALGADSGLYGTTFAGPGDIGRGTVFKLACASSFTFDAPVALDTCCGTNVSITILSTVTNGNTCLSLVTRTWQAIDCCGNSTNCSQTITLVDTTAPYITCASNKTVECGTAWTFDDPSAYDACCGTNVTITILNTVAEGACPQYVTRTWQATDCCGNSNTCSQVVTVVDTTPPTITCASNKTVECGSAWNFDVPIATDLCSGTNVNITILSTVTNGTCPTLITRNWQATDQCGNSTNCSQTVNLVDTTPPVVICAPDKAVECSSCFQCTQLVQTVLHSFGPFDSGFDHVFNAPMRLVIGSDGALYGTMEGIFNNTGTVFTVKTDGSAYRTLLSLPQTPSGNSPDPRAGVLLASDGKFYGTTSQGGTNGSTGLGTVFKLNQDGSGYAMLHSFDGNNDGGNPQGAAVVEGPDGAIYGTTPSYGSGGTGQGTVFKLNKDGSGFAVLHSFPATNGDGLNPYGLLAHTNGAIYGTTSGGGTNLGGTIFKLNPDGSGYTVLYNFVNSGGDGLFPGQGLVIGNGGVLYGATLAGGGDGVGTIFRINPDGSGYSVVRSFSSAAGDGQYPVVGLDPGLDGALYGTTRDGGANGAGTVFRLNADGTSYSVLWSFFATAGSPVAPYAGVVQSGDGSLYGTTALGGTNMSAGTVYSLGCPESLSFDPPTASDDCSGTNVAVTVLSTISQGVCPRLVTRTWLATDQCGNTNICSQTLTVLPFKRDSLRIAGSDDDDDDLVTVTITWEGSGALQQADTIIGPWSYVPGFPMSPYSFKLNRSEPPRFFRLTCGSLAFRGNLSGTVTDNSIPAVGLANAAVTVTDSRGDQIATGHSGPGGAYAIGGLPPGTYTVTFTLSGYTPSSQSVVINPGATTTLNAALFPAVAATVNVTVIDGGTAVPLAAVTVIIYYPSSNSGPLDTDGNGQVTFSNQPVSVAATVVATANDGSGRTVSQNAIFTAGPNSVMLVLPP